MCKIITNSDMYCTCFCGMPWHRSVTIALQESVVINVVDYYFQSDFMFLLSMCRCLKQNNVIGTHIGAIASALGGLTGLAKPQFPDVLFISTTL